MGWEKVIMATSLPVTPPSPRSTRRGGFGRPRCRSGVNHLRQQSPQPGRQLPLRGRRPGPSRFRPRPTADTRPHGGGPPPFSKPEDAIAAQAPRAERRSAGPRHLVRLEACGGPAAPPSPGLRVNARAAPASLRTQRGGPSRPELGTATGRDVTQPPGCLTSFPRRPLKAHTPPKTPGPAPSEASITTRSKR